MKKIMVSLTAASLVFGASAIADVDFDVTGQAKIYYETNDKDGGDLFGTGVNDAGSAESKASVGIQLNANADLGNGFGFGSQATFINTWGLEKKLVSDTAQEDDGQLGSNYIPLTKLYLTKKVGNTTLKGGRQELPKSLSPLAFSESWNVFKNTFDAIVGINSDIPDTTVVAAYVAQSNSSSGTLATGNSLSTFNDMTAVGGAVKITDGAYMLTAANTSIPLTAVTLSYYSLGGLDATAIDPTATLFGGSAMWADVKVAGKELPVGLNIALQGGQIAVDDIEDAAGATILDTTATTAMGAKVGIAVAGATVDAIYTTVNDGTVGVVNVGTGVKTPLYSQLIGNQGYINSDNNTIVVKAGYDMGDFGAISLAYDMTTDNSAAENDYTELDVVYKVKAGGVQYFAAYVKQDADVAAEDNQKVRLWGSYAF